MRLDFSVFDRYVELCMRLGIDAEIECIGLLGIWNKDFGRPIEDYSDCIRLRLYDETTGVYEYVHDTDELAEYVRQFAAHLRAKGWMGIARIASDEPSDEDAFNSSLDFLHSIAPDFRYKIACNHFSFMDRFSDKVFDWVVKLPGVCAKPDAILRLKEQAEQFDGKVAWYVCCNPNYPNQFLRSPLVETRLIGWVTDLFSLSGFLRCDFTVWPDQPWTQTSYKWPIWIAGDMYFVYPGPHGGPVSSVRWEMVRQAVQDYEVLTMVRNAIDASTDAEWKATATDTLEHVRRMVFHDDAKARFYDPAFEPGDIYALDYGTYEKAKRLLLELLAGVR